MRCLVGSVAQGSPINSHVRLRHLSLSCWVASMYVYQKRVKDHFCECFPVVVSLSIALSLVKNVLFQVGLSFFLC